MINTKKQPKITLVGAGPGDAELLTIKGLRAIEKADVVLYDALVGKEILDFIPKKAIRIYVGKRANNHRYTQDEINRMMVQHALLHGHVVRLKGGDAFVFGRGKEEMDFANSYDIETAVVPGISSCIAVPELQGVPLTQRGISESFWVLTGTTKAGILSKDIEVAAQSSATIVVLMGLKKLREITKAFRKNDKGNTSVMVVQNGSTAKEKRAIGTINTIENEVVKQGLGTPAIIVIGEVVAGANIQELTEMIAEETAVKTLSTSSSKSKL